MEFFNNGDKNHESTQKASFVCIYTIITVIYTSPNLKYRNCGVKLTDVGVPACPDATIPGNIRREWVTIRNAPIESFIAESMSYFRYSGMACKCRST